MSRPSPRTQSAERVVRVAAGRQGNRAAAAAAPPPPPPGPALPLLNEKKKEKGGGERREELNSVQDIRFQTVLFYS